MTVLHDHFHNRNQQAFQRLVDASVERAPGRGGPSTSAGKSKSWTRPSYLTSDVVCDVNARDSRGRTVLHLACSAPDGLEYAKLLLRHPSIDVNLPDTESHWTPLHRALYTGNFPVAVLLLRRNDTEKLLPDSDGYSPFDLYNSTLEGTKPQRDAVYAELYTWGANRNAALGQGDADDRAHPDQVIIDKKENHSEVERMNLASRFFPIQVRQIQMSRLHTAVVTSESEGNLHLCGFGSGGRLGPGQHTQYSLKPLPQFNHTIVSVALGQDHTLALNKAGEVLTWGLNRFSQLGYILDAPNAREGFGKVEEPMQATPRKVTALKRVFVKGVAASKTASACWSDQEVFTWGTNNGQLGYPKTSEPQVLPRIATWVVQPVIDVSLTDSVMACLLITRDVICVCNDRHVKISFPVHGFPAEMHPHRPRQGFQGDKIAKITSCDDMLAALSLKGELFTFSALPSDGSASGKEKFSFKPQRVWALRKSFSAVKDVALGSDGSIIVCTESGHVLTRLRVLKTGQSISGGKAFKFQRLPQFQRITRVCANSTGAFAALRVEFKPEPIQLRGNTLGQDLANIQPYLIQGRRNHPPAYRFSDVFCQHDDDMDDSSIETDIFNLVDLLGVLESQKMMNKDQSLPIDLAFSSHHGADVMVRLPSGVVFPSHRVILGARSKPLCALLEGSAFINDKEWKISLKLQGPMNPRSPHYVTYIDLKGCQPISVLILFSFLYSDEVLAIWDRRIFTILDERLKALKIDPNQIKNDLRGLAEVLELPTLAYALQSPSKRPPVPSLGVAMHDLFQSAQNVPQHDPLRSALATDVVLDLADRKVFCHSAVLRARSEFFSDFFDEHDWTMKRWRAGTITVDMKHLNWRVMEYLLSFMCWGAEDLFDTLEFAASVDEVLDFVFDVMAAATELLLDRLVLLCSTAILQHLSLQNACYILAEASHLCAEQLIERAQSFLAVNMELILETGMLDDLPSALVEQLSRYTRMKQEEKSPVTRTGRLTQEAMAKHADWLATQPMTPPEIDDDLVTLVESPSSVQKKRSFVSFSSPGQSPTLRPHRSMRRPPSNDDIFAMDDAEVPVSLKVDEGQASHVTPKPLVWKATVVPKVDMKFVMAEAASKTPPRRRLQSGNQTPATTPSGGSRPPPEPRRIWKSTDSIDAGSSSTWPTPLVPSTPPPTRTLPPTTDTSASPAKRVPSSAPQVPGTGPSPSIPGLGPVFTPTRQGTPSSSTPGPSTGSIRRASGKAWNQASATPPPPATTGMSLLAIQQLELEQQQAGVSQKDKRSLREIQEEEHARQQEENFLAWWAAEEERVKAENEMTAQAQGTTSKPGVGKAAKGKGSRREADHQVGGQSGVVEGGVPRPDQPSTRQEGNVVEATPAGPVEQSGTRPAANKPPRKQQRKKADRPNGEQGPRQPQPVNLRRESEIPQGEENFQAWWAAEEERVRLENEKMKGTGTAVVAPETARPKPFRGQSGQRPPRRKADHPGGRVWTPLSDSGAQKTQT